jgi:predicted HD phosphohydrolase
VSDQAFKVTHNEHHDLSDVAQFAELFALGFNKSESPGSVSLAEHGLQCAEIIAEWYPADRELQAAALLHDLAHHYPTGDECDSAEHAQWHGCIGAEMVRRVLGDRVATFIEWHVPAKRFLITYDAEYLGTLSNVSVQTLLAQGGVMSCEEGNSYRVLPDWQLGLSLRRADDLAKTPGRPTRSFDDWVPVLRSVNSSPPMI